MTKSIISNKYSEVFFAEYTSDLFNGEKNKDIWEQIVAKYITKIQYKRRISNDKR